jgi:uncharacterized Zn finger protein
MAIEKAEIRELCTDAVFERGENYYADGRILDCTRVDDTITATVQGSRRYDVTLSLSDPEFSPLCSCPYDGPGDCKHVVAVLLSLADELPPDEATQIDAILDDIDGDELRAFVRDELARDEGMRDRFVARFGERAKSYEAYRDDVDRLFADHTDRYPVVIDAIDCSQFTELGERYRERGRYRDAAAVYRGLVAGIDDNIHLVDAAYDHYARVFSDALDAYVECVTAADLDRSEHDAHEAFLAERANEGPSPHREQFQRALSELPPGTNT